MLRILLLARLFRIPASAFSTPLAVLPLIALAMTACSPPVVDDSEDNGGEGEGEGENGGDGNCPTVAEGVSVCDVQDSNSQNAVPTESNALLAAVVATTPDFVLDTDNETGEPSVLGVFVSDNPADKRGGVLVTYFADLGGRPDAIAIGDVLRVEGVVKESSIGAPHGETRLQASSLSLSGNNVGDLAPLPVTAADLSEDAGEDYEGVLVTMTDVVIESIGQFGQFNLDNGIIVDDIVYHYPGVAGEVIGSITGVVQYNVFTGGGFRLLPRAPSDVISTDRPTNSVTELNDGTITRCAFDQARNCPAVIADAVVVSPIVFVNDDNDAFDLFTFWVADGNNKDAGGRLGPFSGVRVSVRANPASAGDRAGNYTWEQDDSNDFLPGAAPELGDVIELAGLNTEDFEEGEFEASFIEKKTTVTETPTLAVLPALFDGDAAAALKGGRPTFNGDWVGFEDIAAADNIEQWEGALVELQNVETTNDCYAQPTPFGTPTRLGDFGNFVVTGDVEIANDFFAFPSFAGSFASTVANDARTCDAVRDCDSRVLGQQFDSLVGIVRFKFGRHDLSPRTSTDIQPQSLYVECSAP